MGCVGLFFIGVCRLLGRLLSVACGMYRYAFYGCVSIAWVIASHGCSVASIAYHMAYVVSSLVSAF